jgi:fused signal recognition particle receptor
MKNTEMSKRSIFGRLKDGLSKTRRNFATGVVNALLGKKEINDDIIEALETDLIMADIGVETTHNLITTLTERLARKQLGDNAMALNILKDVMTEILLPVAKPLIIEQHQPYVILMVGVNGSGKTTTAGKLAKLLQQSGKKVMLAAGDTFRAAAIEQLQVWGERNQISVIAQHTGADSASVVFDAFQAAKSRHIDVLIADTAGRLHTQNNLMVELQKVVRVLQKIDANAPHEVMLVLDAGIGQNALQQARQFKQAVNVTGITLTKLDGTAKGGIIFAIADNLHLPIRFIGIGEKIEDLRQFEAKSFVAALFDS